MAQSTTVSTTGVVDSDGFTWANGSYQISFVPNPAYPSLASYQWTGGNLQANALFQGSLSGTGTFSISIPDNTTITPAGTRWQFTICPLASKGCFSVTQPVNGPTRDLTAILNAQAKAPRFPLNGSGYGYDPSEVNPPPQPGIIFYNTTTGACQISTASATFGPCATGGSGTPAGPSFAVQLANSGVTAFQGDSQITINPTQHTLTSFNLAASSIALSPYTYNAKGDNIADDSVPFQNMVNAGCARTSTFGGVVELDIPVPTTLAAAYKITTPITLCSNLHIHGIGYATINYTGTGELFKMSGGTLSARNVEIDHLDMEGTQAASTFAIAFLTTTPTTISSLNDHIHHNLISGWGQSGSGGCISVQNDSQRLTINNNLMACDGADILKSYPTDNLDIYDNIITSYSAVGGWCIDVSDGSGNLASDSGASAQKIEHNNLENCGGSGPSGVLRLNSSADWTIVRNEGESNSAPNNTQNASWTFLNSGFLTFKDNSNFGHAFPAYDFYIANSIHEATFEDNKSQGGSTKTATATQFSITTNVATVTAPNTFFIGELVILGEGVNWAVATYFNGQIVTITSASPTQYSFVVPGGHANVSPTSDVGTAQGLTFYVGTGTANSYRNNHSGNGLTNVYSSAYVGIEGSASNTSSRMYGCQQSAIGGSFVYCNNINVQGTVIGTQANFANYVTAANFNSVTLNGFGNGNVSLSGGMPLSATGIDNLAIGPLSLASLTSGNNNVAGSVDALASLTTGSGNTAHGVSAGFNSSVALQTISNCTFDGFSANASVDGLTDCTAIGDFAQATQSHQVVIGSGAVTQTVINGVGSGCLSATGGVVSGSGLPCGSGAGSVTGSGTSGVYPVWTSSSAIGNGHLNETSNPGDVTATIPIVVQTSTLPAQINMTFNTGHPPTGLAGSAVFAADSSGNGELNSNNSGFSLLCTAANGVCVISASLTTTSATSDNLAITGMTSSGHCSLAATNASGAANIATTYISAKTTNQITITHTATSGMTYDAVCTPF